MAEASLLSQKATLKKADNVNEKLALQRDRINQAKADQENWQEEMHLTRIDGESTAKVLQKTVYKLCPEEDPTD
jgi:hypothetical protein